jgi:hypothetical protein
MKRYLSNLMLVPAFYLTDIGFPTYKADSFEYFYDTFGEAAEPIVEATNLRKVWPKTPSIIRSLTTVSRTGPFPSKAIYIPRIIYHNKHIQQVLTEKIIPKIPLLTQELKKRLQ